ncbi:MAG TPA: hypothetical protein P5282_11240, partial [Anaerolineaceae bacterium]|nr:hypothetical protein [Anaerolineaceae bacterium]
MYAYIAELQRQLSDEANPLPVQELSQNVGDVVALLAKFAEQKDKLARMTEEQRTRLTQMQQALEEQRYKLQQYAQEQREKNAELLVKGQRVPKTAELYT